jgi:hypothetical protein
MTMDPLARGGVDKERRQRLKKGPPEIPQLQVPAGGGAAQTPYPDFDVADEKKWQLDWDGKTREVVTRRVTHVPAYCFFGDDEVALLEAMCARALPQPDRNEDERIPVAPYIDERLFKGGGDGYHYGDMPPDRLAYKYGLTGVEQTARVLYSEPFVRLEGQQQDDVLQQIHDGSPPGKVWQSLPAQRFFQLFMKDVVRTYYAHPRAWAEIGFNGPASPRGHIRLSLGSRDPWEADEKRPRSSTALVKRALRRKQRKEDPKSGQAR